jgi:hypothetical protein
VSARADLLLRRAELHDELAAVDRELAALEAATPPATAEETATTIYGSRAPYAPPPGHSCRWLRDHGPELVALGLAERRGGKRGRSVLYLTTSSQLATFDGMKKKAATSIAPNVKLDVAELDAVDRWVANAGYRQTRSA